MTTGQSWSSIAELYALVPFMVIMMVMSMVMKIATAVTKPEVIKEVAPIVEAALRPPSEKLETALVAKTGMYLPPGR